MHFKPICVFILLLCLSLPTFAQNNTKWTIKDRYIYLNRNPFTFKGVNYSPVPIGSDQDYGDRGDIFTAEYDYIYNRDIPVLRKIGFNSIRIYNCYPWNFPGPESLSADGKTLNDHTDFFDKLWNNGVNPIYVWITHHMSAVFHTIIVNETKTSKSDFWIVDTDRVAYLDPFYEKQDIIARRYNENAFIELARKYGNHPAVAGFIIGNEQNSEPTRGYRQFWEWFDSVAKSIKEIAPDKLTMLTLVDDALKSVSFAELYGSVSHIDVWGINSYRGTKETGFDVLFEEYSDLSNKPLLITEFGPPASTRDSNGKTVILDNNAEEQADYIEVHWDHIMENRDVASGGFIFAWSDEWWKSGDPDVHNPSNVTNDAYPGGYGDEEFFGMNAVKRSNETADNRSGMKPDILTPRASVERMTQSFAKKIDVPNSKGATDLDVATNNTTKPPVTEFQDNELNNNEVDVSITPTVQIRSASSISGFVGSFLNPLFLGSYFAIFIFSLTFNIY